VSEQQSEDVRRQMIATGVPELVQKWSEDSMTTEEMRERFEVLGFQAPFVAVRRLDTGEKGSLMFTNNPRLYFAWKADLDG
jgi:hypothetical protein